MHTKYYCNTLYYNVAAILHCNISENGHFIVAAMQHCCNIFQCFCNDAILQKNIATMLLQYCCAIWDVFYNCLVYVHNRTISISLLKKCPYQSKNKDIMTFIRRSLIYKKDGIM